MLDQLVARVGSDRPIDALEFHSVEALVRTGGGTSIGNGLLRIHAADSARVADAFVRAAFPDFANRVGCFAFDWLGRQFSVDPASMRSRSASVLMCEPGTGQALDIPVELGEFFHREIVDYPDDALAESFFNEWTASGGRAPSFVESVGYRTPLFLGGTDDIANLELVDTAVYWDVVGQMRAETTTRPCGTQIGSVTIDGD